MAIINRKKIRQQSGGGKLQKKRKKKIKMEEDEEGRNELHHWISEIKMTRSMQFISYQIGGEKSKLGLKQNHGCKRGGKWWTISNRQFMWFSKMFWIGYGISLNRGSRVWLLCTRGCPRVFSNWLSYAGVQDFFPSDCRTRVSRSIFKLTVARGCPGVFSNWLSHAVV